MSEKITNLSFCLRGGAGVPGAPELPLRGDAIRLLAVLAPEYVQRVRRVAPEVRKRIHLRHHPVCYGTQPSRYIGNLLASKLKYGFNVVAVLQYHGVL